MGTIEGVMSLAGDHSITSNTTTFLSYRLDSTDEAITQLHFPKCIVTKYWVHVGTNSLNAATTITFRQNGADSGESFTIAAAATGHQASVVTIDVEELDYINLEIDTNASGSGTITLRGGGCFYE